MTTSRQILNAKRSSMEEVGIVLDMDLVGNMMVAEGMVEEGKLRMAEEVGKLKGSEGSPRLREVDRQMAEEDTLKLEGILMAEGIVVLVGIEMVQSMVVLLNTEMQKAVLSIEVREVHTVLMAQTRNYVSLLPHNAVGVVLLQRISQFYSAKSRYSRRIPEKELSAIES